MPKYIIEMCQMKKIGQIAVLRDLSDTYSNCTTTVTAGQQIVELSVCLFQMVQKESKNIISLNYIWAIVSQNNDVQVI